MANIRVLVVDDSAFMRKVITDILNSEPGIEVVGKAKDGQDALEKIEELKPDVVTMDVEMPVMDGLTALKTLMRTRPVPVVMLSSLTAQGAQLTMKALELGAVDFIAKPSGQISLDISGSRNDIVNKVKIAAGTKCLLTSYPTDDAPLAEPPGRTVSPLQAAPGLSKLVLIGTSTGGPKALHQVISKLPRHINAGILIVQHMPPGFTKSLAERLDQISAVRVKEAEMGDRIMPGWAYVAPGDHHLKVVAGIDNWGRKELLVKLDQSPPRHGCRPAVDVMLESVAEQFWSHMVCVIMTGMGHDGAAGMLKVRAKKARTIAEHESTCVVYGMPKTAIETGQVDIIAPLAKIPEAIMQLL
ncbi:MAG: protein-glutamate methylesterase/protein-glutamine glutaminase [Syntrophomonadaceae bacterium]|jgi:two-component system chemotaxis response regulator CheB